MKDVSFNLSKRAGLGKGRILTGVFKSGAGKVKRCGVFSKFLAAGFEVFHLGINVHPSAFMRQIKIFSPHVLVLICQDSTDGVRELIEVIKEEEMRSMTRIILYGQDVGESVRDEVHADAYAESEQELIDMVKEIMKNCFYEFPSSR